MPVAASQAILARLVPGEGPIEVTFEAAGHVHGGREPGAAAAPLAGAAAAAWLERKATLSRFFTQALGFDEIVRINVLDGVRIFFESGDVAHCGLRATRRSYASMPTATRKRAPTRSWSWRCRSPTASCVRCWVPSPDDRPAPARDEGLEDERHAPCGAPRRRPASGARASLHAGGGGPQVHAIVERVQSLSDAEVSSILSTLLADYRERHKDIRGVFRQNYATAVATG